MLTYFIRIPETTNSLPQNTYQLGLGHYSGFSKILITQILLISLQTLFLSRVYLEVRGEGFEPYYQWRYLPSLSPFLSYVYRQLCIQAHEKCHDSLSNVKSITE